MFFVFRKLLKNHIRSNLENVPRPEVVLQDLDLLLRLLLHLRAELLERLELKPKKNKKNLNLHLHLLIIYKSFPRRLLIKEILFNFNPSKQQSWRAESDEFNRKNFVFMI